MALAVLKTRAGVNREAWKAECCLLYYRRISSIGAVIGLLVQFLLFLTHILACSNERIRFSCVDGVRGLALVSGIVGEGTGGNMGGQEYCLWLMGFDCAYCSGRPYLIFRECDYHYDMWEEWQAM